MGYNRHDRTKVFQPDAHVDDAVAHQILDGGGGCGLGMAQIAISKPGLIPDINIELLYAHSDRFPNGVTLISCGLNTGQESSTYSIDFQIRDAPNDGTPTAVATVATAGSIVAENVGALDATAVAAGKYVYAVIPAVDVDRVNIWTTFSVG